MEKGARDVETSEGRKGGREGLRDEKRKERKEGRRKGERNRGTGRGRQVKQARKKEEIRRFRSEKKSGTRRDSPQISYRF